MSRETYIVNVCPRCVEMALGMKFSPVGKGTEVARCDFCKKKKLVGQFNVEMDRKGAKNG